MLQLQPLALKKNRFCRCFCFGLGWISDTDCMFSIVIFFYISICKDEEHVGNTNIESNSLFFWSHVRMAEKTCMIGAEVANWAHLVDKWKWDASPSRWNLQSIDEYVQKDMYMYISYIYKHIDEYITILYMYYKYFTAILQVGCFFSPQLSLAKLFAEFFPSNFAGKPAKTRPQLSQLQWWMSRKLRRLRTRRHRERAKTIQDLNILSRF